MSSKFLIGLIVIYIAGICIGTFYVEAAMVAAGDLNLGSTIIYNVTHGNFSYFFDALTFNFSFFRGDLIYVRFAWLGIWSIAMGYGIWATLKGVPV